LAVTILKEYFYKFVYCLGSAKQLRVVLRWHAAKLVVNVRVGIGFDTVR